MSHHFASLAAYQPVCYKRTSTSGNCFWKSSPNVQSAGIARVGGVCNVGSSKAWVNGRCRQMGFAKWPPSGVWIVRWRLMCCRMHVLITALWVVILEGGGVATDGVFKCSQWSNLQRQPVLWSKGGFKWSWCRRHALMALIRSMPHNGPQGRSIPHNGPQVRYIPITVPG